MLSGMFHSHISERRCVGYCWKHNCHLTSTQVKNKQCLQKQCDALERYEHEFWRQRELTKAKRKNRREKYNAY